MVTKKETVKLIGLEKLDEPDGRIRLEIDRGSIDDLAASIDALGQLQPILVRPKGDRFEIVYGHRRFMAIQQLGKSRILASVKELDNETTALMRATENLQRKDISAVEEAAVYKDLYEQSGMTVEQIAKKMGMSPGIVRRRMDLLKMPPCLQMAVHNKSIGYSVAEELWRLGDLGDIEYYLSFAVDHGATLAVARAWVKSALDEKRRAKTGTEETGGLANPMETRPVYVACDLCSQAMEIGDETVFRSCKTCTKAIRNAMEGGEQ